MSSFCFIELQQMSNKLEKLDLFKLPSIVFVQCTEIWGRFQNAAGPRNPAAGSCTTRTLPLSLLFFLLTPARTDTPHKGKLAGLEKSALRNLELI